MLIQYYRYAQDLMSGTRMRRAFIFSFLMHIFLVILCFSYFWYHKTNFLSIQPAFQVEFVVANAKDTLNPAMSENPTPVAPKSLPPKTIEEKPPEPEQPKPEPPKPEPPKEKEPPPEPPKEKPDIVKPTPKKEPPKKPEPPKKEPPKKEPPKKEPPKKAEPPKPKKAIDSPSNQQTDGKPGDSVIAANVKGALKIGDMAKPMETSPLGLWMGLVKMKVERAWLVPPGAPIMQDACEVTFWVDRSGNLLDTPEVTKEGPLSDLGVSGVKAIQNAAPLPPLPAEYMGSDLQVVFVFNVMQ